MDEGNQVLKLFLTVNWWVQTTESDADDSICRYLA